MGKRLFAVNKNKHGFYSETSWTVIWAAYNQAKADKPCLKTPRQILVKNWLEENHKNIMV